jgi:hypothetical protein
MPFAGTNMPFHHKFAAVLAAIGTAAVLALAYAGWLSPSLVLALADLRWCM